MKLVESEKSSYGLEDTTFRRLVFDATGDSGRTREYFGFLREPGTTSRAPLIGTLANLYLSNKLPVPSNDRKTWYSQVNLRFRGPDNVTQTATIVPHPVMGSHIQGDSWIATGYSEERKTSIGKTVRKMVLGSESGRIVSLEQRKYDRDGVLEEALDLSPGDPESPEESYARIVTRVYPMRKPPLFANIFYSPAYRYLSTDEPNPSAVTTATYDTLVTEREVMVSATDANRQPIGSRPGVIEIPDVDRGATAALDLGPGLERINAKLSLERFKPEGHEIPVIQTLLGGEIKVDSDYGFFTVPHSMSLSEKWAEMMF